jgi:ribosomal protein L37E
MYYFSGNLIHHLNTHRLKGTKNVVCSICGKRAVNKESKFCFDFGFLKKKNKLFNLRFGETYDPALSKR